MTLEETNIVILTSDTRSISHIEPLVCTVFESNRINYDHFGNVLVALTEATNNAIQHGNRCNPEKSVEISYNCGSNMLYFMVRDEGCGFDPENLPDPTDPENLETPNGRGVFLMRRLADSVVFENNGTKVILGFKII